MLELLVAGVMLAVYVGAHVLHGLWGVLSKGHSRGNPPAPAASLPNRLAHLVQSFERKDYLTQTQPELSAF